MYGSYQKYLKYHYKPPYFEQLVRSLTEAFPRSTIDLELRSYNFLGQPVRLITMYQHAIYYKKYRFYMEFSINQASQSIDITGTFLLNGIPLDLPLNEDIVMYVRLISNLNQRMSPIKFNLQPLSGSLSIVGSCSLQMDFASHDKVNKSMLYINNKLVNLVQIVCNHKMILLSILKPDIHIDKYPAELAKYSKKLKSAQSKLKSLQNSLFLIPFDLCSKQSSHVSLLKKQHNLMSYQQHFSQEILQALSVFVGDAESIEYCKQNQLEELSEQAYNDEKQLQAVTTPIDSRLQYNIYTKIHIVNYQKTQWQRLCNGGYGNIDVADARFILVEQTDYVQPKRSGNQQIETKLIRKSDSKALSKRIPKQKEIIFSMKDKSHPNIVSYFDTDSVRAHNYLFTLYEENLSLESMLKRSKGISLYQKIFMLIQASKGLLFLHKNNVLHMDFKPANLVLGKNYLVKLCDFGQSIRWIPGVLPAFKGGYTFPFAPPELYHRDSKNFKEVDVYSMGVTIYWCMFLEHIWGVIPNKANFIKRLKTGEVLPFIVPQKYNSYRTSPIIRILIYLCLMCLRRSQKQSSRPSLSWIITVLEQCKLYLQQMSYG